MEHGERIACSCLEGLIENASEEEKVKCLDVIKNVYGNKIAGKIRENLDIKR